MGTAIGMRIAIVPQLVPVANEVKEATRKTIAGKKSGEMLSVSKFVRKRSVLRLSQQFLSDHAEIRIRHGRRLFLAPLMMHLMRAGIRSECERLAHKTARVRPNRAAKIRMSVLFSVLPMT